MDGQIMERKITYLREKLALGCISLVTGLLAAHFAMFNWIEHTDLYFLLGNYSRYLCAYGGFGAMIFGAMLINDFMVFRTSNTIKHPNKLSKADSNYPRKRTKLFPEDVPWLRDSSSRRSS